MTRWLDLASRLGETLPGTSTYSDLLDQVVEAREAYERASGRRVADAFPDVAGHGAPPVEDRGARSDTA